MIYGYKVGLGYILYALFYLTLNIAPKDTTIICMLALSMGYL